MKYTPFLIAPFGTGLDTDVEPWLAPMDAFTEIVNGHIHHGYVQKRSGYRFLAEMVHGREITAATASTPAVFTVGSATGLANDDSVTLHYLAGGSWANLNGQTYTITGLSGATFSLVDSGGTTVDGSALGAYTANSGRLGTFEGERIMGIFRYIASTNTRQTLIADTERVGIYNSSTNLIDPLDLYDSGGTLRTNNDAFSSSDTDYIVAANWQSAGVVNRVYISNGKAYQSGTPGTDGLLYYDATDRGAPATPNVVQFQPSLGGSNVLYGSKLIFALRQRLVVLHTFEYNGSTTNTFPQRARWCAAQDPTNWDDTTAGGGGYVDAPTGEQIISAQEIQDVIIVHFTDSVWTLRPVSDPSLPFRWDKLNSFRACDGKMATVGYDRYSVALGTRGITATDGVETRRVDTRIQDFVTDEINDSQFGKVFGERSYSNQRMWILYPYTESDDTNAALIYDDDSGAYSTYHINMNVLGYGTNALDYAAQDFVASNDLDKAAQDFDDETSQSFFWSENSELFLGGDTSGKVYIMETENTDDGTPVTFSLISAAWNPFNQQGVEAQFGYIDFFCSSDQTTTVNIQFFKDNNEVPYQSQSIDLLPNLSYLTSITDIIINADPTTGFTVYAPNHGLSAGQSVYFYGVTNALFFNDILWTVGATVTRDTFTVDTSIVSYGSAITGISQASPGVVTSTAHGFVDGDQVYIVNVSGMTEVNNLLFTVANATDDTFELSGVDTSGFTAYSSGGYVFYKYLNGGTVTERKFYRTKVWKRAYAGGIGYQHKIKITSTGVNKPLQIEAFKPWFKPRGKRTLG